MNIVEGYAERTEKVRPSPANPECDGQVEGEAMLYVSES